MCETTLEILIFNTLNLITISSMPFTSYLSNASKYKGKAMLIDFWNTWCVPCINVLPYTVEITQYALKGQKLLAQGIALGNYERKPVAL